MATAGKAAERTWAEEFLAEFDREMKATRKLLAVVPDELVAWKGHEKSMSIGRLAGHVAEIPEWGANILELDQLDITPQAGAQMFSIASNRELLETFDANAQRMRKAIEATTDEDAGKQWRMTFGGREVVNAPRRVAMRQWVMSHLIHHRAQLGVYLRLRNVKIPGMYGPSADEMPGRM